MYWPVILGVILGGWGGASGARAAASGWGGGWSVCWRVPMWGFCSSGAERWGWGGFGCGGGLIFRSVVLGRDARGVFETVVERRRGYSWAG